VLEVNSLHPANGDEHRGDASGLAPNPFVHVSDGAIVAADGTQLLLRGVGLGNWLLPEGYMWGFGDSAASPRQIEQVVATLLGDAPAAAFWDGFRRRFIGEADIAQIAAEGFDHVRLPINWRVLMTQQGEWIEDGFEHIDRLIGWCRTSGITVLLDLHGAPGGQTGTNIDDSLGQPDLFLDPHNQDLTVALWTEIARRYRHEPAVLGYDLLNEPLPNEWQHRFDRELVALYKRLTAAIREADPHHLIMYEGTHWATNWDIFTEVWDPNSVLQFHKYWSPTDRPSIATFLEVGSSLGLPVYMGEGGENTPEWLAAAFQLYEDHSIGWNFWPWKKIATHTSPCSVTAPRGWDRVVAFAAGTGEAPTRDEAELIFADLLDALEFGACTYRTDVVNALFRRGPVRLPAYGFTYRGAGQSYGVATPATAPVIRADEGVALRRRDRSETADFTYPPVEGDGHIVVAELAPGEWLEFEVELAAGAWVVSVVTEGGAGQPPDAGAPVISAGGADLETRAAEGEPGAYRFFAALVQERTARVPLRVTAGGHPVTVVRVEIARAAQ